MKRKILTLFTAAVVVLSTFFIITGSKNSKPSFRIGIIPQDKLEVISTNINGKGMEFTLEFRKGSSHNHPLLVIWAETMDGSYIQTFYVSESIATSTFNYGKQSDGKWKPGTVRRPAALPYWAHKRGIRAPDGFYLPTPDQPIPDAYTGATPLSDFILESRFDEPLEGKFRLLLEINQSWDWNEYWTNNLYPDDKEYKSSSQPALVYMAEIDGNKSGKYEMKVIGHSHYAGRDGSLTTDLSTLTSALDILSSATVKIRGNK